MAKQTSIKGWTTFMVLGSFKDSATGLNFFIVRMPSGRVPFQKKIVPAIRRQVMTYFTPEDRAAAAREKLMRGGSDRLHWTIDGEPEIGSYWNLTKSRPRRYEWNGTELVPVPYEG
jgi:hypothetical protein